MNNPLGLRVVDLDAERKADNEKKFYEDGVAYSFNDMKYTTFEFRKACRDVGKKAEDA